MSLEIRYDALQILYIKTVEITVCSQFVVFSVGEVIRKAEIHSLIHFSSSYSQPASVCLLVSPHSDHKSCCY